MRVGSRVRALMLVLTFLVMASPLASAQTEFAATPEVETPAETPMVTETPVVDTTPEVTPEVTPEPGVEGPQVGDETTPPATTPESTPQTQTRAGDVGTMDAGYTVFVTLTTSDGGEVPAGTNVCIWGSIDTTCREWLGVELTFDLWGEYASYEVQVPTESGYSSLWGSVYAPLGEPAELDLVLQEQAEVSISLVDGEGAPAPAGIEVCVYSNSTYGCDFWTGTPMTFMVDAGRVDYEVSPGPESGFAIADGTFRVAAGESVNQTITLQASATVNVDVVYVGGAPQPENTYVFMSPSYEENAIYTGETLTFTVTPGQVRYSTDAWGENDRYQDVFGTITVAPGETVDLTITLEPAGPGTLRVYVSTDFGAPVPAGTQVCISMPEPDAGDPIENLCQAVTGPSVTFTNLDRGDVYVTVTTPEGSAYEGGEMGGYWVDLEKTTRVYAVLESNEAAFDATVEMTVRMSDNSPLESMEGACLIPGSIDNVLMLIELGCIEPSDGSLNEDGTVATFIFQVPEGPFTYVVMADRLAFGTVTATSGVTTPVDVVLQAGPAGVEPATINADVVTLDGGSVPAGTIVCVVPLAAVSSGDPGDIDDYCQEWTGSTAAFEASAGPTILVASPPEGSGYLTETSVLIRITEPGRTYNETLTLYPEELETGITMSVSDEAPQSGDTVSYTIRAYGSSPEWGRLAYSGQAEVAFEITDVLPEELSDISVSCAGTYFPAVPSGTCYDLDGNTLTVFGGFWESGIYDITVTVTGTITGEPGTEVTNTAYVYQDMRGPVAEQVEENLIASTTLSGLAFQVVPSVPSASVTLVIAGQEPVETPIPGETPVATETPIPGETPVATETPAAGETPAATATATAAATPAGVSALPNTGSGAGAGTSLAIVGGLAAAFAALGAGLRVRTHRTRA